MAQQRLFRSEVIEAQREQSLGSVHLAIPPSFLWLAILATLFAAAVVLFMVFGHYTRVARVVGELVPSASPLRVQSPSLGTVARVYVHEGETVHHGDALVEVSRERNSAALDPGQAPIGAQLHAPVKQPNEQLTDQQQSAHAQVAGVQMMLGMLHQQSRQIDAQITLEQQQVASLRSVLGELPTLLKKGHVSAYQIAQQRGNALRLKSQIAATTDQRLETRQQLAETGLQRDVVLRAPIDGVVSTFLVKNGQSVSVGQPLLSILPSGTTLQARLLVPSSAIDFVHQGNRVAIRYQAFPYQKFGQQYGWVESVSPGALANSEALVLTGARAPQPLYRVLLTLHRQTIDAYGKASPLKPGMTVSANIALDRRSLWQMAFAPLSGLKQQLASGASPR